MGFSAIYGCMFMYISTSRAFTGILREHYRKSFPAVQSDVFRIRTTMSQSMTEHLDSELSMQPHFQFRKSRSMKLAVKDELEGDWRKCWMLLNFWFYLQMLCFSLYCSMGQILFYSVPLLFLPMLVLYSHTDTNTDSFMKPCGNAKKKKKYYIYWSWNMVLGLLTVFTLQDITCLNVTCPYIADVGWDGHFRFNLC